MAREIKTEPCASCRAPVTVTRHTARARGGAPYCDRCGATPITAGYFESSRPTTRRRSERTERAERGEHRRTPQDPADLQLRYSSKMIDRIAQEDEDRLRSALHEAAHVVVARVLGAQLHECRVVPTGGETRFTPDNPDDLGIVLAAGAAAELLFFGDVRGAGPDERQAAELLTPAEIAEAHSLAEHAVRINRPLILALGQRLRSRREVDGPELEAMLDEVAGQGRVVLENRSTAAWVEGPNGPEPPYAAALRRSPAERTYAFTQGG